MPALFRQHRLVEEPHVAEAHTAQRFRRREPIPRAAVKLFLAIFPSPPLIRHNLTEPLTYGHWQTEATRYEHGDGLSLGLEQGFRPSPRQRPVRPHFDVGIPAPKLDSVLPATPHATVAQGLCVSVVRGRQTSARTGLFRSLETGLFR